MTDNRTNKIALKTAIALLLTLILSFSIMLNFVNNPFAEASVLPSEQILPGDIAEGQGDFIFYNEAEFQGKKYKVYRNQKLCATPVELASSQGHYFNADNKKHVPINFSKSKDEVYSVGVEVASSLGVSTGADAFGIEATLEVEATATLGLTAAIGKGYTESLTYTLNPNTDKTGVYYIVTNAFVREYEVETYHLESVQTGTKTERLWYTLWIATKEVPVYENQWVKKTIKKFCLPESYYYTLQYYA